MGDELEKSVLFNLWKDRYTVKWIKQSIKNPRQRVMPTDKRLTVYYFDKHRDASFKRFEDTSEGPLVRIADYVSKSYSPNKYFWTTNSKYFGRIRERMIGKYILPKAHGRNDLDHFDMCVWLAAMKSNFVDSANLQKVCGMTKFELDLSREYNALYQFVMRTSLRDFNATSDVEVFVFSKLQAEYLNERLGGKMVHIESVVKDKPVSKGGRPRKAKVPLTSKQRAKKSGLMKRKGYSEEDALAAVLPGDAEVSDIDEEYQQSLTIIDLMFEVERHWGLLEEERYQNHVAERKASIAARKIREIPLVQVDPGFCETHINTSANRFAER